MKKLSAITVLAALAFAVGTPVIAQTVNPTSYVRSSSYVVADNTMRTSRLVGATVYTDNGDKFGTIEDVLVKDSASEPTVVLSVGDYIGGGAKLVAVPLSHVQLNASKPTMAGVTKEMLKAMPAFIFPVGGANG